ncbi:MAG: heterodisulfide reductase-related iron-sulfur binding cluster [Methanoregula sp.]|nr:heterodisulfide reductase-related iron-sulfur binding cluster [Methanoregula sp.]
MRSEELKRAIYRCGKCKLCSITTFHPARDYLPLCPSGTYYKYQAFYAPGRLEVLRGILDEEVGNTGELLKIAYGCTLCGACHEKCKEISSIDLNHAEIFEDMRNRLVGRGILPEAHREITERVRETGNAYGVTTKKTYPSRRSGDTLYFIGCTSRYREPEIMDSMIAVLEAIGEEFSILDDETCCGSVLFRTGQRDAARELVERNIRAIEESGAKRLVFTCPGCMMTFKKNYPDLGVELLHSTEFIAQHLNDLKVRHLGMNVTYHDPCHLGRHLGIYDAPREILNRIANLHEMKRTREQAWCCGSGGGVKSAFGDFALWTAGERVKEAKLTADVLTSACPFCKRNLAEASDGMEVYDIVELVKLALEVQS